MGLIPPQPGFLEGLRELCTRHSALLILDEVMTGFGRTGQWFGFQQFDTTPDILALGKGMGGGYFPVGAAAVSARVADTIAQKSGLFAAGFTWAGNPMAAAVVCKAIDYLREHELVERCTKMGDYLGAKLEDLRSHPTVGDVRGMGLMRGIEFVKDKQTKEPLDPERRFWVELGREALRRGMFIESSGGCDRGQAGDMMMFGPPFIVTEEEIDEMVGLFDEVLGSVEKRMGF